MKFKASGLIRGKGYMPHIFRAGLLVFCLFSVNALWAQNIALPSKVDLFQYSASSSGYDLTGKPDARIWGWSRDGKIAYSLESINSFSGMLAGSFIIFDAISDEIVVELVKSADDFHSGEDLYNNEYMASISNAIRTHNIVTGQRHDFLPFPIRKNNMAYDCQISNLVYGNHEYGFFDNRFISNYDVVIMANGKRKVIGNYASMDVGPGALYICGYLLSPYEERALVVVAEESYSFEGESGLRYRLNGCHLGVGFN